MMKPLLPAQLTASIRILCSLALLAWSASRCHAAEALDAALDTIAPGLTKWATVCVVEASGTDAPVFHWTDYRDTGSSTDFWPASTIKLYAVIGAMELLQEHGFPLDTQVQFEHQNPDGTWTVDCTRSMREMASEVFRRSSNEDYTLLLRMVGIDRINTQLLIPERGFPHSALMRGYVLGRPYGYVREEPQRITFSTPDGSKTQTIEHHWSGRFYAGERGCTVIDKNTGNVTSPRELAECLRRVLFHEKLPEPERYRLSTEQLGFLRQGSEGFFGLENKNEKSSPCAWHGIQNVFPEARFFHKVGVISNYALEVAAVNDEKTGTYFILVPVVNAGGTNPAGGEGMIAEMSRAIAEWVRGGDGEKADLKPQRRKDAEEKTEN